MSAEQICEPTGALGRWIFGPIKYLKSSVPKLPVNAILGTTAAVLGCAVVFVAFRHFRKPKDGKWKEKDEQKNESEAGVQPTEQVNQGDSTQSKHVADDNAKDTIVSTKQVSEESGLQEEPEPVNEPQDVVQGAEDIIMSTEGVSDESVLEEEPEPFSEPQDVVHVPEETITVTEDVIDESVLEEEPEPFSEPQDVVHVPEEMITNTEGVSDESILEEEPEPFSEPQDSVHVPEEMITVTEDVIDESILEEEPEPFSEPQDVVHVPEEMITVTEDVIDESILEEEPEPFSEPQDVVHDAEEMITNTEDVIDESGLQEEPEPFSEPQDVVHGAEDIIMSTEVVSDEPVLEEEPEPFDEPQDVVHGAEETIAITEDVIEQSDLEKEPEQSSEPEDMVPDTWEMISVTEDVSEESDLKKEPEDTVPDTWDMISNSADVSEESDLKEEPEDMVPDTWDMISNSPDVSEESDLKEEPEPEPALEPAPPAPPAPSEKLLRTLFHSCVYQRALDLCWEEESFFSQVMLMVELLKLQQKRLLPPKVTVENLTEFLMEEFCRSEGARLWVEELDIYQDTDIDQLLAMVWQVNVRMKMRDVEFEAHRRLSSRVVRMPSFQNAETSKVSQDIACSLMAMPPEKFSCKRFGPQEVVMEVVLKVLQGFWPHPSGLSHTIMASLHLSDTAVSVTKAVFDWLAPTLSTMSHRATFSRTDRDDKVLSIHNKVRQLYAKHVLEKELNSFSPKLLTTIVEVTVQEIYQLFCK